MLSNATEKTEIVSYKIILGGIYMYLKMKYCLKIFELAKHYSI